jgi:hypothetical protein
MAGGDRGPQCRIPHPIRHAETWPDPTNHAEPRHSWRSCHTTRWRLDWLADDAVRCGPVSEPKFPASRELAGNFSKKGPPSHIFASKTREVSKRYRTIPYSTEQGIFLPEQGICFAEQGISTRLQRLRTRGDLERIDVDSVTIRQAGLPRALSWW